MQNLLSKLNEVLFQSLTGRLKTYILQTIRLIQKMFQSLTGRLKTRGKEFHPVFGERMFQSLTGRLKT